MTNFIAIKKTTLTSEMCSTRSTLLKNGKYAAWNLENARIAAKGLLEFEDLGLEIGDLRTEPLITENNDPLKETKIGEKITL